ncbi:MAG: hypothetical protein PVJ27_06525 [Candidatus Brocadiaceae bacterium]|jgi:hypothetical protein
MAKLDVSEGLIEELAAEAAPLVAELTGWELGLRTLVCRVLPKDRGYEEVVLGRIRGAGVSLDGEHEKGLLERLLEYVVEGNCLAAYEPGTEQLLVVRENVDESNLAGLELIVAHELVHRGQHVNHGYLIERINRAVRAAFACLEEPEPRFREACARVAEVTPVMTLLESHAAYVQEALRRSHLPDARIESHFSLPALLLRVFGGAKLSQYREALPAVARATREGSLDALYGSV